MQNIFVYGTLCDAEIRKTILDAEPDSRPAFLTGFRMSSINLNGVIYPIISEDPLSREVIKGEYFAVNDDDLKKLDEYESDAYRRKLVVLENLVSAWVYYK